MKPQSVKRLRLGLLALFTVLVTIASYRHITLGGGKAPSIHALCPYGGLESLYQLFTTGSFISKIYQGTLILFLITLALAFLFRRSFCGLLCPFGALQEFMGAAGRRLFKRQLQMPSAWDRPLRFLKYGVLLLTTAYAWKTSGLWMAPYDPWSAYAHLPEGLSSVWAESAIGLVLLAVTLIGSLLVDRFFCKYLCPMGALYGLVGKASPFRVVRNPHQCIDCGKCSRVCPVNLDVQLMTEVRSAECISCSLCVLDCPKAGALENRFGGKKVPAGVAILASIVFFFGAILGAQAAGIYPLTPPAPVEGQTIAYSEVKGYMSIEDAARFTGLELDAFYKAFDIPESVPASTLMKGISESVPGYDFDAVKEALGSGSQETVSGTEAASEAPESAPDYSLVKGSMTIEAAAAAISVDLETFYELFGIPEEVPSGTVLRDIGTIIPGYDFHTVKSRLEGE